MQSLEQLTEALLALPSQSRAQLAEKLVESLEFDTDPAIQTAWVNEAQQRRAQIQAQAVQPIPGEAAPNPVRRLREQ